MIFQPNDLPPHYALDTPKEDVFLGHQKAQKKRGRSKAADDTTEQPAAETIMVDAINPGYVGKAKGLRQVLWERGWLCPGKKYTMKGIIVNGTIDPTTSLVQIMANCSDFRNERTLMEELVEERGHEFDKSPKCHPELAGDGVEYDWGKSKHDFRAKNDGVPLHLRAHIKASFAGLTRERRFLFSRKARSYKRAYLALARGEGELESNGAAPFAEIERLSKQCKTHRCALDMNRVFILSA